MSRWSEARVVWHARAAVHERLSRRGRRELICWNPKAGGGSQHLSPHQGVGCHLQAQAGTLKANAEELRQKISEAHATLDDKRHTVSVLDERYQA